MPACLAERRLDFNEVGGTLAEIVQLTKGCADLAKRSYDADVSFGAYPEVASQNANASDRREVITACSSGRTVSKRSTYDPEIGVARASPELITCAMNHGWKPLGH